MSKKFYINRNVLSVNLVVLTIGDTVTFDYNGESRTGVVEALKLEQFTQEKAVTIRNEKYVKCFNDSKMENLAVVK